MAKSLLSKLGKRIKKGVLIAGAVASIGLASCNPCFTNYPPVAELYVNPTSVELDQPANITLTGTDKNGQNDIIEYKIGIDKNSNNEIDSDEVITSGSSQIIDYPVTFDTSGTKRVIGKVTDTQGSFGKKSINVVVSGTPEENYIDISGRLEDCENDGVGRQGVIRVYDIKNPDGSFSDLLTESQTDINGNFSFTLDKLVDSDDKIYLRAITGTPSSPASYTRTIELDAVDNNPITDPKGNPAVRPTPFYSDFDNDGYADLDKNKNGIIELQEKEDFIEHVGRVNFNYWQNGLTKWNHGELPDDALTTYYHPLFKGIQISNDFTIGEQNSIENAIRNSGYLKAGEIDITRGDSHNLELGWGFIRLSNPGEPPSTRIYEQYGPDGYPDGYIERFVTNLDHLQATSKGLVNHETGHGLLYTGHVDSESTLALFNSIMKYTSYDPRYSPPERPEEFTPVDIKENYTIDESTHQGMEPEEDILEMTF
jgi:hypothetical protein